MLDVDLHSHSTHSDGLLTPAALVARAHGNGVQTYALTDHDTLSGLPDARAAAESHGMRFINGVEISVSWAHETLHIVGLNFDALHEDITEGLLTVRAGRHERAARIYERLKSINPVYETIIGSVFGAPSSRRPSCGRVR